MHRLLLTIGISFQTALACADCQFSIINFTDYPVSAEVGFFGGNSSMLTIPASESRIIKLKNDYNCTDTTPLGLGRTYIKFPKDPNGAGAVYSPQDNQIQLTGKATGIRNGRPLTSDSGNPIWLSYTGNAITPERFEVKLNYVKRPNTFSAGTD